MHRGSGVEDVEMDDIPMRERLQSRPYSGDNGTWVSYAFRRQAENEAANKKRRDVQSEMEKENSEEAPYSHAHRTQH